MLDCRQWIVSVRFGAYRDCPSKLETVSSTKKEHVRLKANGDFKLDFVQAGVCKVRTAHQPLKEQRTTGYIAPEVAGDFFNGQPKRPDKQNLLRFSPTVDWHRLLYLLNVQTRVKSLFEKSESVFERGYFG